MSLWAISGAPLILALDVTTPIGPATMATLTNPEVLAVDQDPRALQATRYVAGINIDATDLRKLGHCDELNV
ncbi:hypothetical protein ADM96_01995 [Burkholderia sp. ST111]|jgi:hypothetical protein|uniref:hypothetical protein n=1 Tax=Paraburkholderia nemoris TaxID=2793076 RepID=UPI0006B61A3F|nr:hypothetical protein [Paraburkholderia nemoris]KPD20068.1 hypothetical protein ADM96_01995 [Burkholderia sp. ST111]CAE6812082.1 hypothetical protein LMG22931_05919 [Paraburkholderia nemoris]